MDLEDAELLQMERDAATLRLAADRIAKQLAMLQPKLAEAEKREARDAIVLRAGDVTAIGADSNTRIAKQYPDLLRRIVKSFLLPEHAAYQAEFDMQQVVQREREQDLDVSGIDVLEGVAVISVHGILLQRLGFARNLR